MVRAELRDMDDCSLLLDKVEGVAIFGNQVILSHSYFEIHCMCGFCTDRLSDCFPRMIKLDVFGLPKVLDPKF